MSETRQTKGRACIRVTDALMEYAPVKIEHPKAGEIRWGMMEVKELFDTFQSFLLLPEGYSIVGVYYEPMYQLWSVVVESEAILLPPQDEMIPSLNPTYGRIEDGTVNGKVRLVDMNVPLRWQYYAGEKGK